MNFRTEQNTKYLFVVAVVVDYFIIYIYIYLKYFIKFWGEKKNVWYFTGSNFSSTEHQFRKIAFLHIS